ncbi:MAG: hypothetical protein HOP30_18660 [Cyclobacteriaceae bacterium]|nr:hypothetical protein [Cyclobacteriaceae bacterium]
MKSRAMVVASMLMLVSVFTFANKSNDSQLEVVAQQSKSILKVIYQGTSNGKAVLKVYNQAGEVVFMDRVFTEKGFIRPLNFTGMEKGTYKIEVSTSQGTSVKSVEYGATEETKAVVTTSEASTVKAVHIAKLNAEGKYLIAISNQGENNVTVRIYDGNKNIVSNKRISINGNYGVVYNLKDVVGTPSIEVTDKAGNTTTK